MKAKHIKKAACEQFSHNCKLKPQSTRFSYANNGYPSPDNVPGLCLWNNLNTVIPLEVTNSTSNCWGMVLEGSDIVKHVFVL